MINQAQEGTADAEDPVNDPHTENVLLLFIEDTFKTGEDGCTAHKQKTKVNVQRGKDQRRQTDGQQGGIFHNGDAPEVALNDAARKKLLDTRGENVNDLAKTEAADIKEGRLRLKRVKYIRVFVAEKP